MASTATPELIGLAQRTLRELRLRVAGASGGGPDALREAGYAGAPSLFDAFETWLADRGSGKAEDLAIDEFSQRAGEFFQNAGWGRVTFHSLHDALAVIDIENCWEAQLHGEGERGCHLTTFYKGNFGPQMIAAAQKRAGLDVRVIATWQERDAFRSAEMLEHAYERVARGLGWESIGAGEF